MVTFSRHYRSPGRSSPFSPGRTGRPGKPGGSSRPHQRPGYVGPFEPLDPDKKRHYELSRRLGRGLGRFMPWLIIGEQVWEWWQTPEYFPTEFDAGLVPDPGTCCLALGGCPPAQTSSQWHNWNAVYVGGGACQTVNVPTSDKNALDAAVWPGSGDPGDRMYQMGNWSGGPDFWRLRIHRYGTVVGDSYKQWVQVQTIPSPLAPPVARTLPSYDPFKVPPLVPSPPPIGIPPGLQPFRPPLRDRVERPERTRPPRRPPVTLPPRFDPPRPPQRGEKEKKFKTQASATFFMWLSKIMNFGTEAIDFLEAVWLGLPRHMRSGRSIGGGKGDVTPQQAIQELYDHFHEINDEIVGQMIANLIENAVEDSIVGRFEAEWAKANRRLGRRQTNRPRLPPLDTDWDSLEKWLGVNLW